MVTEFENPNNAAVVQQQEAGEVRPRPLWAGKLVDALQVLFGAAGAEEERCEIGEVRLRLCSNVRFFTTDELELLLGDLYDLLWERDRMSARLNELLKKGSVNIPFHPAP